MSELIYKTVDEWLDSYDLTAKQLTKEELEEVQEMFEYWTNAEEEGCVILDGDLMELKTKVTFREMLADLDVKRSKKTFFQKYPNVKRSENIKCLDLVMKREFAEAILSGEKTVEFRDYSPFYTSRLMDRKLEAIGETISEEDMEDFVDFARPLREVEKIHFHDYNNTWFLDVECVDNWTVVVNDEGVEDLRKEYGCHELDDLLEDLNSRNATERPIFYYFALGSVLGTNLK